VEEGESKGGRGGGGGGSVVKGYDECFFRLRTLCASIQKT
jgi:hypothetical protein